jgi:Zn-dependent protease with chaperone function
MDKRTIYITGSHIGRAVFTAIGSLIWLSGLLIVLFILSAFFRDISFFDNWGNALSEPYILKIIGIACFILAALVIFMGTSAGEWFLKLLFNMRKMTVREEKRLNPIIYQLKKEYAAKFDEPLDIKIYIVDSNFMNGFALGYSTIAIHRAALDQLEDKEIKALIAHEIGHLHHRDGGYSAMLLGLHSPISIQVAISNFTGSDPDKQKERIKNNQIFAGIAFIKLIFMFPFYIASFLALPFLWLAKMIQNVGAWQMEYRADKFAEEMGLKKGMISLLEKFESMDERDRHGFMSKYGFSHPPVALRIDALERSEG